MKLTFAPDPSLLGGEVRRTEVAVSEDETMKDILERVKMFLCIWLNAAGGDKKEKEWQLSLEGGVKVDLKFTPKELHLYDGQTLFVNLKDEVPCNPLDTMDNGSEVCDVFSSSFASSSCSNDVSVFDDFHTSQNNAQIPTEEDILRYEEAKRAALSRAREIERSRGLDYVSHRKILHDEAVDDYDDEEYSGCEYYEDVRYGAGEEQRNINEDDLYRSGECAVDDDFDNGYDVAERNRNLNVNTNNSNTNVNRHNPISPFR